MRFCTFSIHDEVSWGVHSDGGIIDLGARIGGSTLRMLEENAVEATVDQAVNSNVDHDLASVTLLPPITQPEKVACIGVNYAKRNAEYKDGSDIPKWPSLFMRTIDSFTGHDQAVWRPPESNQLDYEGEIALVIGKTGHRIAEDQALDYIAGLTLVNEGTLRDWIRHAKFNVTQGKNFVRSGSIGPWFVTADEFTRFDNLTLTTRVNGEQRQHDTTANLMFPFQYLVSYLSTFFILKPGDVISTGTPIGAGCHLDPPQYLVPGDIIEIEAPGIGLLRNTVIDDPSVA